MTTRAILKELMAIEYQIDTFMQKIEVKIQQHAKLKEELSSHSNIMVELAKKELLEKANKLEVTTESL